MNNIINHKASNFVGILAVLASYVRRFHVDNVEEVYFNKTNILLRNTATPREG